MDSPLNHFSVEVFSSGAICCFMAVKLIKLMVC
jgi:hypothetical protein